MGKLDVCHEKMDLKKVGCGHARQFLFWYDNDEDLKVCFLVTHVSLSLLVLGRLREHDHNYYSMQYTLTTRQHKLL